MKNYFKKGITLIELVVVIIILILLAVIAILNARPTQDKAEYAAVLSEFKAVYTAVNTMKDLYDQGYDLVEGQDYCALNQYSPDDVWYVVYGMQDYSPNSGDNKYNEEVVIKHFGVDELKRSYEFKIHDTNSLNQDDVEVRYYNGRTVNISGYIVNSYKDIQSIKNEMSK